MPSDRVPEAVLSRIWNDGWHSREMRTVDGRRVGVVYRGVWTHSNGPDFRDAMIEFDGRLLQGAVELHVRESDWTAHGHHLDPAYDAVILHVVLEQNQTQGACGPSGKDIPTVQIEPFLYGPIDQFLASVTPLELGSIGQYACLPTLAGQRPGEIHSVLRREGWKRLAEKQLRFQQEMVRHPAGETLYRGVLDSLGLTANRAGMGAVADRLPLLLAERIAREYGLVGLNAVFLGCGGFLPLSPGHHALIADHNLDTGSIETCWHELAREYDLTPVSMLVWNLNRVRPLNHPVRRLASLASLLDEVTEDGLLAWVMRTPLERGAGWERWLMSARPAIGKSRRGQIIVNALAPFAAAFAAETEDQALIEQAAEVWESLRGSVDDDVARKTVKQIAGENRFRVSSALEVQGLHQIGRHGCANLRCFECPIAALAVRFERQRFSD